MAQRGVCVGEGNGACIEQGAVQPHTATPQSLTLPPKKAIVKQHANERTPVYPKCLGSLPWDELAEAASKLGAKLVREGALMDSDVDMSLKLKLHTEELRKSISNMDSRKLFDSLVFDVMSEQMEPLLSANSESIANVLGIGVTTLNRFVPQAFGIPRWPARAFQAQETAEKVLKVSLEEAKNRKPLRRNWRIGLERSQSTRKHARDGETFPPGDELKKGSENSVH